MAYREGLEPALRGISATIKGGEKVGVVGRTGAGKSSMLAVLLRLQELQSGTVKIDGEDIKLMGLATLRSRVGSVPQVSEWSEWVDSIRILIPPERARQRARPGLDQVVAVDRWESLCLRTAALMRGSPG
jgi:ABC-type cobalamin/Fe3+-siderophores transport system ATPase subunit